jgi:C4-dicarboxylate transporter DctM subunit
MEPASVILILAPIMFPIAVALGIDPIHLGIIMTVNMEIGLITPPVGLNLFVTAGVAGMDLNQVVRAAAPWLGVLVAVLLLITYVPAISLALPGWLGLLG